MDWNNPNFIAAATVSAVPLICFLIIFIFTRNNHKLSYCISITGALACMLSGWYLLANNWSAQKPLVFSVPWLTSGEFIRIPFGFLLDPLSLLMLTIVVTIVFLVQVYSVGYMAGDPGMGRYFSFLSLFSWSMTNLVIAPELIQLYVFWELVGLSSYLLIGFWYEKWSASQAGKKAFVVTRIGDVGMFLGLAIIILSPGIHTLDILKLNSPGTAAALGPGLLTLSAILVFTGSIGKSAQFPLHVWLPDAMEGPTPVSSVLHSATMVAAGVYLLARIFPFYSQSADAMFFALSIGTITMLLASTMGMVATDIKQVWAYSTISQLGFMIMGLAAGAYAAGVFHLTTHAAFKCLLFNAAGALIHTYHTNDFFVMSEKGAKGQRVPVITMTVAACALAGLPFTAGFFSKEAIIAGLERLDNPFWLIAGLVGAGMTAYYTFRVIFVLWRPSSEVVGYAAPVMARDLHAAHAGHDEHHHGTPAVMAFPLIFLATLSIVLGYVGQPLQRFLLRDKAVVWSLERLGLMGGHGEHAAHGGGLLAALGVHLTPMLFMAIGVALSGVIWAWYDWGRKGCKRVGFLHACEPLEELFRRRWYIDDFYRWLIDRVLYGTFSRACIMHDRRVIDSGVDGVVGLTVGGGRVLSFLQSGMVQYNMLIAFAVVGLIGLYFLFGC
ncbi:MAG: NADH-quinone oxidoreductase subunit L [Pseudomonadota bacterium]